MAHFLRVFLALVLLAPGAQGEVPKVVTDIAPVQSLVAMVMQGLGVPAVIVAPGAAPHGASLRPSQAVALQGGDLVIWIGPDLTPRLAKPIETLAAQAKRVTLLHTPGTRLLQYPTGAAATDHDGNDPGQADPHAWLDPENAKVWLARIAEDLSRLDPQHAGTYRANATAAQRDLTDLQSELTLLLKPMKNRPYVSLHDAYRYFENRFGLSPVGSVTSGDARSPGPAALSRLRAKLTVGQDICAFGAPGYDPALLYAATGRTDLAIIPLDAMGSRLDAGPDLYFALLREMGRAFASCPQGPG